MGDQLRRRLGKLPDALDVAADVAGCIARKGFQPLAVTVEHGQRAGPLPGPIKDPFDRMLIAQSMLDGLQLRLDRALLRRPRRPAPVVSRRPVWSEAGGPGRGVGAWVGDCRTLLFTKPVPSIRCSPRRSARERTDRPTVPRALVAPHRGKGKVRASPHRSARRSCSGPEYEECTANWAV
jgi:hypothetical protein